VSLSVLLLTLESLWFCIEKGFANKYKEIYTDYGLRHYPWRARRFYLHYTLFLRGLRDRISPPSRVTITQLRSFAEIAGRPPLPEPRLLQPTYIVPFIVLLNTLLLEALKHADLLKGPAGIVILILSTFLLVFLYGVLRVWYGVTNWGQVVDRDIQRFLQWAESDIEEAQRLKTWGRL
jgi:hypothetical protein